MSSGEMNLHVQKRGFLQEFKLSDVQVILAAGLQQSNIHILSPVLCLTVIGSE